MYLPNIVLLSLCCYLSSSRSLYFVFFLFLVRLFLMSYSISTLQLCITSTGAMSFRWYCKWFALTCREKNNEASYPKFFVNLIIFLVSLRWAEFLFFFWLWILVCDLIVTRFENLRCRWMLGGRCQISWYTSWIWTTPRPAHYTTVL